MVHTVSSALINAISIDNAGNWALANNSNWTSGLTSNTKYTIQVKLSGTLLGNTVNGAGDTSEVTIDTTIADAPVGTHTVAISNDAGVLDNDRITNDSAVKGVEFQQYCCLCNVGGGGEGREGGRQRKRQLRERRKRRGSEVEKEGATVGSAEVREEEGRRRSSLWL